MIVFLDRSRRAGPRLEWKVLLFSVGAVVALVGLYFDERWMTGTAIVLLLGGGLSLRFLPSSGDADADGDADRDDDTE